MNYQVPKKKKKHCGFMQLKKTVYYIIRKHINTISMTIILAAKQQMKMKTVL